MEGETLFAIAGAIAFAANIIQAAFVRKKAFSIEGAEDELAAAGRVPKSTVAPEAVRGQDAQASLRGTV